MSDIPLELFLDFKSQWDEDRRRWRLPAQLTQNIKNVKLWISGKEIQSNDFQLINGYIKLSGKYKIKEDIRVVAELELNRISQLSFFKQNLIIAIVSLMKSGKKFTLYTYLS